ncbi:hypothetical protein BDD12DRAFT_881587 [Trichophaea hybrida]|nr:hypothetical protein BDD12DRAFT_881587 [Trichophaea hybrida]
MFSMRNSALVSYSDGIFTRYSASTNRTYSDHQSDLIAFLSIIQKYNIDFLNITWQPALNNLGQGGSGTISQSTFNADMTLAFKRFHEPGDPDSEDSENDFLPLMSEVLILSQPLIQIHPNIVNLEGICWEIKSKTEKAVPVLVFEKAPWDLQQFMNVSEGMSMSINDRLNICADIGSAIMALHSYDVIHGDIKPQNVLVYKDASGNTTIKITDFGYSTLATGEEGRVFLPKSRPWNAPEHHFGGFTAAEAKKTDIYSFGMLCLWFLFGNTIQNTPQHTAEGITEFISFDAPLRPRTLLEQIKDDDKLVGITDQLLDSIPLAGLNGEHTIPLKTFFRLTVALNPNKRSSGLGKLVGLFSQEGIKLDAAILVEEISERSSYTDFRIALTLANLVQTDYRVRSQIRESLENIYFRNPNQPFATHIAFQIAFAYHIGFGAKSDDNKCRVWLERSNKHIHDLKLEKEAVQPASWNNEKLRELQGLVSVDLIHEYRTRGLNELEKARKECEREVSDMAREFGEFHFIMLNLYKTFGNMLDELGELATSKALRIRIRDNIKKEGGVTHPYYVQSFFDLATSHTKLGEWMEAQRVQEEVVNNESIHSSEIESIKNNLAFTYKNMGRWKEAEELEVQVLETSLRVLGQEHPHTLISKSNLASTYKRQGRWNEAEELEVQVMDMRLRVLGQEHPDTLASMGNLASTYRNKKQLKEAERFEVKVMETFERVLGQEHPYTLTSVANLASTLWNQGRWKEAEELEVKVMETRKRVLGEQHPATMISMGNLAVTYKYHRRWKEAEELEMYVIEMEKKVLGPDHPSILASMSNLASTYSFQRRWKEAEVLGVYVVETSVRILGQTHPDTLKRMANLASTYWSQGRWKEAEKLQIEVIKTERRVLGEEHLSTLTSIACLGLTYEKQGRWKEAEELELQVMEKFKTVLGRDHPSTLTITGNLSSTFWNQGKWKESEELEVQLLETRKRILGQEHPETLTSMNNLATIYSKQRKWTQAEEQQMQVTNTFQMTLGEDDPSTVVAIVNLAVIRKNLEALRYSWDENRLERELQELREGFSIQFKDKLPQFATARSLDDGNDGKEILCNTILQKSHDDDDFGADTQRPEFALAESQELDYNDTEQDVPRRALGLSVEAEEDNQANHERLQRALAMPIEDNIDNKEIGCSNDNIHQ